MIEVCNKRDLVGQFGVCDIYIGRPSVLGNPFVIGRDGDRQAVVEQYRDWLGRALQDEYGAVAIELRRIALAAVPSLDEGRNATSPTVRLFCWCAPLECHGDVIKEVVERYLDTGEWSVRP